MSVAVHDQRVAFADRAGRAESVADRFGGALDVPKPKRGGLVKKVGPFSKRNNPL